MRKKICALNILHSKDLGVNHIVVFASVHPPVVMEEMGQILQEAMQELLLWIQVVSLDLHLEYL